MHTQNEEISKLIYPLRYESGCIVDRNGDVIVKMNRELGTTPLVPSYRDDLAKELINLYNESHNPALLTITWSTEDIIDRAKDVNDRVITEDQAIEILAMLDGSQDTSIGVNWEVIDIVTEQYFDDKK